MKKKILIFMMALAGLVLSGCQSSSTELDEPEGEGRLIIMTSFYPVYVFTQEVAGDLANVDMMVKGADAHGFEPSARDLATLEESDAFIYANPEMETWVPTLVESLSSSTLIIETDKNIELIHTEDAGDEESDNEGHHHLIDPHTWLDPVLAKKQVTEIKKALVELDPENETTYTENAESFIVELKELNQDYERAFESADHRLFITQHAAFGYLAHRYNLIQESLTGLSSETEASPQRMAEMTDLIREEEVPVVYYNSNSNSDLAQTVAEEASIETELLHSLESVENEEFHSGQGYLNLMRENLENLKKTIR
ncbi:MAG: zinc ABC transporter substrate-binding protein [Atopococcus tabaci]|uniref:Zinc ABC transporter substrate-binding protein n=1 Tax=Atopococcus tabaci TaxID=269774 RepID=A0AA43ZSP5_9LACT|nr:zinc ABC transporter substrate-binding protein [Atopococcus tabaci]